MKKRMMLTVAVALAALPLLAATPSKPAAKKAKPVATEAARRAFVRGNTVMGDAKTPEDYAEAARLYEEAVAAAPSWPEPLFNLAKARELRGEFDAAIAALEKYLKAGGADAREAQDLVYALEAKRERAAKAKAAEETLVEPGVRAGPLRLGMSLEEAKAKLGPGVCQEFRDGAYCDWRADKGLGASVLNGRVSHIEVYSASYATKEGVRVGSTESTLRGAFGAALETQMHTVYSTREDAMRQTNGVQAVEHWRTRGLRLRPGQGGVVGLVEVIAP
jgi:tetratricopeptide (TPR) repeat protein